MSKLNIAPSEIAEAIQKIKSVSTPDEKRDLLMELAAYHAYTAEMFQKYHSARRIAVAVRIVELRTEKIETTDARGNVKVKDKYTLGDAEAKALSDNSDVYSVEKLWLGLLDGLREAIQALKLDINYEKEAMKHMAMEEIQ